MSPRAGLTREKVLDAAAELLDRHGPSGLTTAELAAHLRVRAPSLYNHMESLEQVQQELATRALKQLAAEMRQAATGRASAEALTAMAHAYRGFALAHPGLYALTLRPRPDSPENLSASEEVLSVVLAVLRGYRLSNDEALHATRCLRSALHGFVSLESAGGFGLPLDLDGSFARLILLLDQGLQRHQFS